MIFNIVFLVLIISLVIVKTRTIVLRNNVDPKNEKRILISGVLIVLFIITNATLPYPESLYWFIGLGVIFTSLILSYKILGSEFKRFIYLQPKDKIVNVLFYTLVVVVTSIYF